MGKYSKEAIGNMARIVVAAKSFKRTIRRRSMRVRKLEGPFEPVEIVLESKEELAALESIIGFFDGSELPRRVETFMIGLSAGLRKARK